MDPAETKELALGPAFSLVIAERVLIVTVWVDVWILLVLSTAPTESRSFVLVFVFVFANGTLRFGGT